MKAQKKDGGGLKALKSDLSTGSIGSLYVFYGEEAYLRDHYLAQLKEKLVTPGMEGFNFHALEGKGLDVQELEGAVNTPPVMSGGKLICVRDFDLYKADAPARGRLEELFSALPADCCLVFVYDLLEFKPDARVKLHGVITRCGLAVEFARQSQADLTSWIRRRFAALGREIDPKNADYLIFLCGGLMSGLITEIEKIAAYAKETRVTRADIDAVAVPELDAVVYDMTDAIASRRFDKAMEILHSLYKMRLEPIVLLGAIGRQLRQLYSARLMLDERRGVSPMMKLWGFHSAYPAERLLKDAALLDRNWCRRAVVLCAQTDLMLKSTGADKERSLELLLIRLSIREETV